MTLDEQTAILEQHEGFVRSQAQYWQRKNPLVDMDGLMQEGRLALLYAAKRSDGRASLVTYASHWIRRAMRNYVMSTVFPVRIPSHAFNAVSFVVAKFGTVSMDKPFDDSDATLGDLMAAPMQEVQMHEQTDLVELVERAMEKLTPQQRAVLKARFIDGRKLREVATDYGVTRERIRQIEVKALKLLRANPLLKRA